MGFVQGLAQCFAHGSPDGAGLSFDLALQSTHDGALAFDGPAHAFELAGMGIASGLATLFSGFLGEGLLEFDPGVLGRFYQLGACRL